MSYVQQKWDTSSYINPTRMNHIEEGIKSNSDDVDELMKEPKGSVLKEQLDLLQARVDTIIPEGTPTEGNAELIDIRVGADGTVYQSAGNAVREQITKVNNDITTINTNIDNINNDITEISGNVSGISKDVDFNRKLIKALIGDVYDEQDITNYATEIDYPANALPFAELQMLGGMSIANHDEGSIIDAKVEQIVSRGKNILDFENFLNYRNDVPSASTQYNTVEKISKDTYKIFGSTSMMELGYIVDVVPNKTYRIWCDSSTVIDGNSRLGTATIYDGLSDTSTALLKNASFLSKDSIKTFTPTSKKVLVLLAVTGGSGSGTGTMKCPMISVFDVEHYSPYKAPIVKPIPTSIQSLPDYGKGINADCFNYVDFKPTVYHNIKTVDMGDLTWKYTSAGLGFMYCDTVDIVPSTMEVFCSKYETIRNTEYQSRIGIFAHGGVIGLVVNGSGYTDANKFKSDHKGVLVHYKAKTDGEDYEARLYHHKVGVVDLGSLAWSDGSASDSTHRRMYSSSIASIVKKPSASSAIANIMCGKYSTISADQTYAMINGIAIHSNGNVFAYDENIQNSADFKTAMNGVLLYYELETEGILDVTDMIPEDFEIIEGEGGGTILFDYPEKAYKIGVPSTIEFQLKM